MSTVNRTGETSSEYRAPFRPRPIAIANRIGRMLSLVGIGGAPLDAGRLIAAARRKTGLDRFGDETFVEPLGKLLEWVLPNV